jgi:Asp-tRNA(Asn)/Glu-tRNA(Gln) amidotransferase A subunit family amidase
MEQTRREFVKTAVTFGICAAISQELASTCRAATNRMETLTDWLKADADARKLGLEQYLARIKELEPSIHAWVQVQPEMPTGDGPLNGIPFGVKDIIETKGMATEYGSPLYRGRLGTTDAAIVRDLRRRGAVLIGKTVTTAFAYRTPGPTRNPRNLEHTPGGSSSGSAAAVAAGMVPFAVGEQTRGSMIRPASYCGVTGFKPTHDLLPTEGMLILSKNSDTIGLFTHTPADMIALWNAMGRPTGSPEEFSFAACEPAPDCDPEMTHAFQDSLALLRKSGIHIESIDIRDRLKKLDEASDTEVFYEGARANEVRLKEFGDRLDQPLADLVRAGLKMPVVKYDEAQRYLADSRTKFAEIFKATPVILTPAAPGPAPLGIATTGDPRMNAPWTALGTPAITIPMPTSNGLPLGLQLTADLGQDARLLQAALRVQQHFDAAPNPHSA